MKFSSPGDTQIPHIHPKKNQMQLPVHLIKWLSLPIDIWNTKAYFFHIVNMLPVLSLFLCLLCLGMCWLPSNADTAQLCTVQWYLVTQVLHRVVWSTSLILGSYYSKKYLNQVLYSLFYHIQQSSCPYSTPCPCNYKPC